VVRLQVSSDQSSLSSLSPLPLYESTSFLACLPTQQINSWSNSTHNKLMLREYLSWQLFVESKEFPQKFPQNSSYIHLVSIESFMYPWRIRCGQGNKTKLTKALSLLSPFMCCAKLPHSCLTYWDPMDCTPLSLGFSRQEYWIGLPCPSPGDLPNPGIEAVSLVSPALTGGLITTSTTSYLMAKRCGVTK